MKIINKDKYFLVLTNLFFKLNKYDYDAIVCLKRSGFIMGAYLSNQLGLPLFTPAEIDKIPKELNRILVVDDKIFTGKSINKVKRQLLKKYFQVKTATLFCQSNIFPDIYLEKLNGIYKMWYEVKI